MEDSFTGKVMRKSFARDVEAAFREMWRRMPARDGSPVSQNMARAVPERLRRTERSKFRNCPCYSRKLPIFHPSIQHFKLPFDTTQRVVSRKRSRFIARCWLESPVTAPPCIISGSSRPKSVVRKLPSISFGEQLPLRRIFPGRIQIWETPSRALAALPKQSKRTKKRFEERRNRRRLDIILGMRIWPRGASNERSTLIERRLV